MRGCQQGLCGRVSVTAWKRLLVSSALERARLRDVELAPRRALWPASLWG